MLNVMQVCAYVSIAVNNYYVPRPACYCHVCGVVNSFYRAMLAQSAVMRQ